MASMAAPDSCWLEVCCTRCRGLTFTIQLHLPAGMQLVCCGCGKRYGPEQVTSQA